MLQDMKAKARRDFIRRRALAITDYTIGLLEIGPASGCPACQVLAISCQVFGPTIPSGTNPLSR